MRGIAAASPTTLSRLGPRVGFVDLPEIDESHVDTLTLADVRRAVAQMEGTPASFDFVNADGAPIEEEAEVLASRFLPAICIRPRGYAWEISSSSAIESISTASADASRSPSPTELAIHVEQQQPAATSRQPHQAPMHPLRRRVLRAALLQIWRRNAAERRDARSLRVSAATSAEETQLLRRFTSWRRQAAASDTSSSVSVSSDDDATPIRVREVATPVRPPPRRSEGAEEADAASEHGAEISVALFAGSGSRGDAAFVAQAEAQHSEERSIASAAAAAKIHVDRYGSVTTTARGDDAPRRSRAAVHVSRHGSVDVRYPAAHRANANANANTATLVELGADTHGASGDASDASSGGDGGERGAIENGAANHNNETHGEARRRRVQVVTLQRKYRKARELLRAAKGERATSDARVFRAERDADAARRAAAKTAASAAAVRARAKLDEGELERVTELASALGARLTGARSHISQSESRTEQLENALLHMESVLKADRELSERKDAAAITHAQRLNREVDAARRVHESLRARVGELQRNLAAERTGTIKLQGRLEMEMGALAAERRRAGVDEVSATTQRATRRTQRVQRQLDELAGKHREALAEAAALKSLELRTAAERDHSERAALERSEAAASVQKRCVMLQAQVLALGNGHDQRVQQWGAEEKLQRAAMADASATEATLRDSIDAAQSECSQHIERIAEVEDKLRAAVAVAAAAAASSTAIEETNAMLRAEIVEHECAREALAEALQKGGAAAVTAATDHASRDAASSNHISELTSALITAQTEEAVQRSLARTATESWQSALSAVAAAQQQAKDSARMVDGLSARMSEESTRADALEECSRDEALRAAASHDELNAAIAEVRRSASDAEAAAALRYESAAHELHRALEAESAAEKRAEAAVDTARFDAAEHELSRALSDRAATEERLEGALRDVNARYATAESELSRALEDKSTVEIELKAELERTLAAESTAKLQLKAAEHAALAAATSSNVRIEAAARDADASANVAMRARRESKIMALSEAHVAFDREQGAKEDDRVTQLSRIGDVIEARNARVLLARTWHCWFRCTSAALIAKRKVSMDTAKQLAEELAAQSVAYEEEVATLRERNGAQQRTATAQAEDLARLESAHSVEALAARDAESMLQDASNALRFELNEERQSIATMRDRFHVFAVALAAACAGTSAAEHALRVASRATEAVHRQVHGDLLSENDASYTSMRKAQSQLHEFQRAAHTQLDALRGETEAEREASAFAMDALTLNTHELTAELVEARGMLNEQAAATTDASAAIAALSAECTSAEAALERAERHANDAAALERARLQSSQALEIERLTRSHNATMEEALISFDETTAKVVDATARAAASAASRQEESAAQQLREQFALELNAVREAHEAERKKSSRAVLRIPGHDIADLPSRIMLEAQLKAARAELNGAHIRMQLMDNQMAAVVAESARSVNAMRDGIVRRQVLTAPLVVPSSAVPALRIVGRGGGGGGGDTTTPTRAGSAAVHVDRHGSVFISHNTNSIASSGGAQLMTNVSRSHLFDVDATQSAHAASPGGTHGGNGGAEAWLQQQLDMGGDGEYDSSPLFRSPERSPSTDVLGASEQCRSPALSESEGEMRAASWLQHKEKEYYVQPERWPGHTSSSIPDEALRAPPQFVTNALRSLDRSVERRGPQLSLSSAMNEATTAAATVAVRQMQNLLEKQPQRSEAEATKLFEAGRQVEIAAARQALAEVKLELSTQHERDEAEASALRAAAAELQRNADELEATSAASSAENLARLQRSQAQCAALEMSVASERAAYEHSQVALQRAESDSEATSRAFKTFEEAATAREEAQRTQFVELQATLREQQLHEAATLAQHERATVVAAERFARNIEALRRTGELQAESAHEVGAHAVARLLRRPGEKRLSRAICTLQQRCAASAIAHLRRELTQEKRDVEELRAALEAAQREAARRGEEDDRRAAEEERCRAANDADDEPAALPSPASAPAVLRRWGRFVISVTTAQRRARCIAVFQQWRRAVAAAVPLATPHASASIKRERADGAAAAEAAAEAEAHVDEDAAHENEHESANRMMSVASAKDDAVLLRELREVRALLQHAHSAVENVEESNVSYHTRVQQDHDCDPNEETQARVQQGQVQGQVLAQQELTSAHPTAAPQTPVPRLKLLLGNGAGPLYERVARLDAEMKRKELELELRGLRLE